MMSRYITLTDYESHSPIIVNMAEIEAVETFKYFGTYIKTSKKFFYVCESEKYVREMWHGC